MAYSILLAAIGAIIYTWVVYPVALRSLLLIVRRRAGAAQETRKTPVVSIIIAAHNEEQTIAAKLRNCLELAYPPEQIEIIVASDASTDRTSEIVHAMADDEQRIRWVESKARAGKSGVQNLAAAHARGDLLLFTDTGTRMPAECLATMVEHFADPRVGLVTATVYFGEPADAVEKGQSAYWRYELFLRSAESDLGILSTGSGQALLVWRGLFCPLPACYGDDCIMPLDVRLQGFHVIHCREAIVFDSMPSSIGGELRARIRMTSRNWSGTWSRPAIFNPLRFPMTAVGLVSHKLLRWLSPFFLAAIFVSNTALAFAGKALSLWWIQLGFYGSAFLGWQLVRNHKRSWVFGYPFSFCLANAGFLFGMIKAFRNQKIVAY